MTYKYYDVRREIYENCSDKSLKKFRTFKEMKKLFKGLQWLMLALMIAYAIAMIIIAIFPISILWNTIPVIFVIAISILSQFTFEKLYHKEARKEELSMKGQSYKEYIDNILNTLKENGIDSVKKITVLKEECKCALAQHKQKYDSVKSKVFDMLIGIPLGALISSLIYKNSDAVVMQIFVLLLIGFFVIAFSNIVRKITFYSDGYFKDKRLLDVLNEIEYAENNWSSGF